MTAAATRYSERYQATGGLAAVGILNQLGRPDAEALETLVREAVQNCWDAKIRDRVRVDIGRVTLTGDRLRAAHDLLDDPPPGLPIQETVREGAHILYFADYGTHGLRGPVRADESGPYRDWVDLVLNVGQPPDKDLAGGSFGYGKAAFYLASAARTVVIDTLCLTDAGGVERRLIASGLGANYRDAKGRPHTGRHWWAAPGNTDPLPLTGSAAALIAERLGLPDRSTREHLGTTIAVVAFDIGFPTDVEAGGDPVMRFIGEALAWNFWPRMIDTPGSVRHTLAFTLIDDGHRVVVPNPRQHPRLRDFTTAMDRLREEPGDPDDGLVIDVPVVRHRPTLTLGRLVVARGVDPGPLPERDGVTVGARVTASGVHHVALMRTPEIVVRYLPGEPSSNPRLGYSGVFRCDHSLDAAFRDSEPPAHDDWVPRAVADASLRSHVNVALARVREACRLVAGYTTSASGESGGGLALGEFADALAVLLPGGVGSGARRQTGPRLLGKPRRRHNPASSDAAPPNSDWSSDTGSDDLPAGAPPAQPSDRADHVANHEAAVANTVEGGATTGHDSESVAAGRPKAAIRRPQLRIPDEPQLGLTDDGLPQLSQHFDLRTHGRPTTVVVEVEIMTTDGQRVEDEAPVGEDEPKILGWTAPDGSHYATSRLDAPAGCDGRWRVDIGLVGAAMVRLDLTAEPA